MIYDLRIQKVLSGYLHVRTRHFRLTFILLLLSTGRIGQELQARKTLRSVFFLLVGHVFFAPAHWKMTSSDHDSTRQRLLFIKHCLYGWREAIPPFHEYIVLRNCF